MSEHQKPTSLQTEQHGGSHYKGMVIEPAEYLQKNHIGFCEGEAIKYLSRHARKGKATDIRKAIHFCKMVLEFEYGETYENPPPPPSEVIIDVRGEDRTR